MFLAFQAVTWSLVQMCGCISGTRPAQNCSTFLQLVACYCNSTVSSRPLSYRSTTLICGTTITQEGIKLTKTVTWIWKRGEAGGGAGGEGEPTQIGLFVSSTQHWKRNLWVCGGLKTSLFLTYCKQLLPEDKTSWSFLQEISKCLCLERQVSGTHSKARKCLKNRRVQGFSFKEISRSPGLYHRGGRSGCRGQPPAWCIFASDFWGANPLSCSDSFCQSVKLVKPWFFDFFMYEVGIIIEPALRGGLFRIQ